MSLLLAVTSQRGTPTQLIVQTNDPQKAITAAAYMGYLNPQVLGPSTYEDQSRIHCQRGYYVTETSTREYI